MTDMTDMNEAADETETETVPPDNSLRAGHWYKLLLAPSHKEQIVIGARVNSIDEVGHSTFVNMTYRCRGRGRGGPKVVKTESFNADRITKFEPLSEPDPEALTFWRVGKTLEAELAKVLRIDDQKVATEKTEAMKEKKRAYNKAAYERRKAEKAAALLPPKTPTQQPPKARTHTPTTSQVQTKIVDSGPVVMTATPEPAPAPEPVKPPVGLADAPATAAELMESIARKFEQKQSEKQTEPAPVAAPETQPAETVMVAPVAPAIDDDLDKEEAKIPEPPKTPEIITIKDSGPVTKQDLEEARADLDDDEIVIPKPAMTIPPKLPLKLPPRRKGFIDDDASGRVASFEEIEAEIASLNKPSKEPIDYNKKVVKVDHVARWLEDVDEQDEVDDGDEP